MSATFTVNTQLVCPHGGTVKAMPKSSLVTIDGAVVVTTSDTWLVQGCTFVNPATNTPNPCTSVVWSGGDELVTVGHAPTISNAALGMCVGSVAPGPPILVETQTKVQTK